jgi:Predicted nucleotide-binding protein containing TIR-like domain
MKLSIKQTLEESFGPNSIEYQRYLGAAVPSRGPTSLASPFGSGAQDLRYRQYYDESKQKSIATLKQVIAALNERADALGAGGIPPPLNVIFELGYFVGVLGPERVAAIIAAGVERPSDFEGIVHIPIESDWRTQIGQEPEAAGFEFDWNKAMGRT